MDDFGVTYELIGKNGSLIIRQKFFKTEAALIKFCDKLPERDDFHRVVSYSGPIHPSEWKR